jgi:lipopolysaccharide biosynthesis glycosyltransferase
MKTALCLTPDLAFFRQAWFTAATILQHEEAGALDLFIVCEPGDIAPGLEHLSPALRDRVTILIEDFSAFDRGASGRGVFSRAVFRRLFLDRVLPPKYTRIVALDADMLIRTPGLGRLASIDLGGAPLAAAYDMIFLMDFNGGALARKFLAQRLSLGLAPDAPYFNAGLMVIDRDKWREANIGERAMRAILDHPSRHPMMEQSALNELLAGDFAPLSPRYNFMGDFFLLGLEAKIDPIALHFVNRPKPWDVEQWRGETRYARAYRDWFATSPWPDYLATATISEHPRIPRKTAARDRFARRLEAFLETCDFVDLPRGALKSPENRLAGKSFR